MEQVKEKEKLPHCKHSCNILQALTGRNIGLLYCKCCKTNVQILESIAERKMIAKEHQELMYELPQYPRATFLVIFSPDGTKIASTHGNHNIYISDVASRKTLRILSGHPRSPWCIKFHPYRKNILASGCLGGIVNMWDIQDGNKIWNAEFKTVIASLAFHPFKKLLVVATHNKLCLCDCSQPEPIATVSTKNEDRKFRYIGFDNLGKKLITGIENAKSEEMNPKVRRRIQIYPNPAGQLSERLLRNPYGITQGMDVGDIPSVGVTGNYRVQAWDFSKGELPDISNSTKNVVIEKCKILNDASISISSDGTFLAAGFSRAVGVFSLQWETLGEELFWTYTYDASVISVSISPTQEHLVVGLANHLRNESEIYTIGNIYRLMHKQQQDEREYLCFAEGKETKVKRLLSRDSWIPKSMSINCIKWAPQPGQGLIYGTNSGRLTMLN